ncbi:MAG TPA: POTRA domain-containing protein [Terracidiphilus sp.]|nr:POTRA domain-containing protein [Terracidiphilus sp.]
MSRLQRFRPATQWLGVLIFAVLAASRAPAQTPRSVSTQVPETLPATEQMLSAYDGQNVSSVRAVGTLQANAMQLQSLFVQKEGQPFSHEKVNETAAALKTAGSLEAVRIDVEPEAKGIAVRFVLEPAIYFGIFQFPGAERFPYSQLIQVADLPVQRAFSEQEVERAQDKLIAFFRQEGYFQVEESPEVSVDRQHDVANVQFHVTLGRRARFGSTQIVGASPSDEALLHRKLISLMARLRGSAIRPGKTYHHSTLTKASHNLQTTLAGQGYLSAQVQLTAASYHADTNRADIQFTIDAGARTHVNISGAHIWPWTRKALLPMYQGIGVDSESVLEGKQGLTSFFQKKGYFDVQVDSNLQTSPAGDTVTYRITRGKKHKVTSVSIAGNRQLPSSELTPQLAVETKHLLSPGAFSDKLVQTSVKNLTSVYNSEGFSDARITPTVTHKDGNVQVAFRIVEGPRDIVNALSIEGANTFSEAQFAPGGLKLAVGQPYSQGRVAADRANIVAHYLEAGYLTSSFRETATSVSKKEPHRINVVYHIDEGPRVSAGTVLTLGREHTRPRLIDRDVADIKPNQPLTETHLLTAGSNLYEHTGVFDWAEVDPRRPITTQTREDVLVKVHEAKRHEFTYGFGFEVINRGGNIPSGTVALPNLPPIGLPSNFTASQQTFYGPRGTAQYTLNNLRGKGESLSFTAFAGRLDQKGAVYYIDPTFRWSPWKATTSASVEKDETNPIFSSEIAIGSFQVQRPVDRARQNTVFFRYSYSDTNISRVLIPALVPTADQHVRLSTLAANFTRDTRDNPLDEHKGMLDSLELDFNTGKLGSSVDFTKLTGQAAFFKEKFHHIVWANSLRIGLAQPLLNSRVPLSESFFTGGGNTLRGFPLDGAGPQRQVQVCSSGSSSNCTFIQVPAGGNELLILNAEARIPLPIKKGLSIVPFYDGGNVFPIVGFHDFTSLYSNNAGIGLRYSTPVGPIRVDIGRNLNPIPGITATQYFISIGQAF